MKTEFPCGLSTGQQETSGVLPLYRALPSPSHGHCWRNKRGHPRHNHQILQHRPQPDPSAHIEMEDLAREWVETTFDVEAMKIIWAGGQRAFELHHKLASIVANDPIFRKDNKPNMTRKELFIGGIRKAARCRELAPELGISEDDARTLRTLRGEKAYDDLHWNMFIPVLRPWYIEHQ
jgi:hypothetical protein